MTPTILPASGVRLYQITIAGVIDEEFVASYCPPETVLLRERETTTLANIQADQAGILGLVRHLHNLGCAILSVTC